MRLTIVPSDNTVYVDGVCKPGLDLTECNIPSDIHALQWFDVKGWIEFSNGEDPFAPKPANEFIESLPQWADKSVAAWYAAKEA